MADSAWHTFRDIDTACGLPKGSAFRAFKRMRHNLRENTDFVVLSAGTHAERIDALRRDDRVYRTSINIVLLSPQTRKDIEVALTG